MNWRDFLYFRKGEKTLIFLLLFLITVTLIVNIVVTSRKKSDIIIPQNDSLIVAFEKFKDNLKLKEKEMHPERKYTRDPYSTRENKSKNNTYEKTYDKKSDNFVPYPKIEKLSENEMIAINETDTAIWKRVPGIGSTYAMRIVKYRNLLGGFVSIDQLREVYGMNEELFSKISNYIVLDDNYQKVNINKLDFKQLLRHPYLNDKQVKAIFNLRRKKGKVESLNELAMLDEFTSEDIERLTLYLEF